MKKVIHKWKSTQDHSKVILLPADDYGGQASDDYQFLFTAMLNDW